MWPRSCFSARARSPSTSATSSGSLRSAPAPSLPASTSTRRARVPPRAPIRPIGRCEPRRLLYLIDCSRKRHCDRFREAIRPRLLVVAKVVGEPGVDPQSDRKRGVARSPASDAAEGTPLAGAGFATAATSRRMFSGRDAVGVRSAAVERATVRLARRCAWKQRRDWLGHGLVGREPDRLFVVADLERCSGEEGVGCLCLRDLDFEPSSAEADSEGETWKRRWQSGCEGELAVVVAHAAEAGDGGEPGACERGDVDAVAAVVLEVVKVDQRGFGEVVVGELEVTDFGGDHRLRGGGEGGVADGEGFVVGEVARLLLVGEGVAAPVQREDEVGLLDDLFAVELEVGEVQEQRVALGGGGGEVPALVLGEALRLRVHAARLVPREKHVAGGGPPGGGFFSVDGELRGAMRVAGDGVGCRIEVPLREQVGVDVVVGECAVLVGSGDAVDAEAALPVVVAERSPKSCCLDEQLEPDLALELVVVGCRLVAHDRVGDVGADVEGGRPGGPVAGAFLAADRPPGEGGPLEPKLVGPFPCEVERLGAPAERLRRPWGRCRSAAAARSARYPRRYGRRSRARSGPWRRSRAALLARWLGGCERARTAAPAGARCRRRSRV